MAWRLETLQSAWSDGVPTQIRRADGSFSCRPPVGQEVQCQLHHCQSMATVHKPLLLVICGSHCCSSGGCSAPLDCFPKQPSPNVRALPRMLYFMLGHLLLSTCRTSTVDAAKNLILQPDANVILKCSLPLPLSRALFNTVLQAEIPLLSALFQSECKHPAISRC
jgi:hypothetical protein